jgi:type II secretory pathway component PulJ
MINIGLVRKKIRHIGNQKGFTLVDILVGLAMASVLMAATVSLFTTMGRSYTTQNVAADVQQVARAGIELMIQQIRMAGFDPSGSAAAAILPNFDDTSVFDDAHNAQVADTDANQIAFTIDADMDGRIDNCRNGDGTPKCPDEDDNIENELIAYRLNDGSIEKYRGASGVINPTWEAFTEQNVSNLTFNYFDRNNNPTTDPSRIATVEISLTMQEPAGRGGTVSRAYSTRVRCRNIGL